MTETLRELDATKQELFAEVLRRCMGIGPDDNARYDFGDINGGALQRPTEVAAELLRALSDEGLTIAALARSESPSPEGLTALHEAIGTGDGETGLEHWHTASGGRAPGERAGVYVDRQQVHDLIDRMLR